MYAEHPSILPVPEETVIWRFMDYAKFCAMLQDSALFFARPNTFADPWEGHYPELHYDPTQYVDIADERTRAFLATSSKLTAEMGRKDFAVSCWYMGEHESEALWRLNRNRGVAIKTTVKKLKEALSLHEDHEVYIAKIIYKDYKKEMIDMGNVFFPILHKRKSFEYENELRAVIWEKANVGGKGVRPFDSSRGHNVKILPSALIYEVHLSPFEHQWFHDLVSKTITDVGLNAPCHLSKLMEGPSGTV